MCSITEEETVKRGVKQWHEYLQNPKRSNFLESKKGDTNVLSVESGGRWERIGGGEMIKMDLRCRTRGDSGKSVGGGEFHRGPRGGENMCKGKKEEGRKGIVG